VDDGEADVQQLVEDALDEHADRDDAEPERGIPEVSAPRPLERAVTDGGSRDG
jgi:hypothetical protein